MMPRAAELLARFALENGRLTDMIAKPKLFEPNRRLELSVFNIDGLAHEKIRQLGIGVARQHPTSRRLHGWGEIDTTAVYETGLRVEYDNEPPRHASIVGWPDDVSERKQKQQLLARSSRSVRLDPPASVS